MVNVSRYRYEFWPWYLFFLPLVPLYILLVIRTRRLLYFTVVNPRIEMGGIFGESKIEILNAIPLQYKPKTIFLKFNNGFDELLLDTLDYPIILKPNVGERGNGVLLRQSKAEALEVLYKTDIDLIIQEYINYELELGILYYKMPKSGKTGITSITQKGFLKVIGDGISTVADLLKLNVRGALQLKRLQLEKADLLQSVPKINETVLVEPRGNHCLGTTFINANHKKNKQLVSIFDSITQHYEGFYFGRFDLKVSDWESLYKGDNIKIFEVNGVTSEPGHIYDSEYTLLKAYTDVAKQMILVSNIAIENKERGVMTAPIGHFFKVISNHFWKSNNKH